MTFCQKRFPNLPSKCLEYRVRSQDAIFNLTAETPALALLTLLPPTPPTTMPQGLQKGLYPVSYEAQFVEAGNLPDDSTPPGSPSHA